MVSASPNSSNRPGNSISGRSAVTAPQARAVGPSRPCTQSAGTPSRNLCGSTTGGPASLFPDSTSTAPAAVVTSGASDPTVSSERASGMTPRALTVPYVGLKPTTPQSEAGTRIDPAVSVPIAQSHSPAATAAADPPEDPPALLLGSRGLRTAPKCGLSLLAPYAHS